MATNKQYNKSGLYYDLDGKAIDVLAWAGLFEHNRFLRETYVFFQQFRISTIYLGIDHMWGMSNKPYIFETMVFCFIPFCTDYEIYQCRYTSKRQALKGHAKLVKYYGTIRFLLQHLYTHHLWRGGEQ